MKKVTGERAETHYERVNTDTGEIYQIKPEYVTMSRRPGLGANWIEKYMDEVYPSDEVIVDGKKTPPPAYYDRRYELSNPKGWEEVLNKRKAKARSQKEEYTPERLAVKEVCARARSGFSTRDL